MPLHTIKGLLSIYKRPNHRYLTQSKINSSINSQSKTIMRYNHTARPSLNPKQPWYKNPFSEGLLLKPSWIFQSIGTFAASLVISSIFWKIGKNEKERKDKKDILEEVRHEADINWAKTQKILAHLELNTASNLSKINSKFILDTQDIQAFEEKNKELTLKLKQIEAIQNTLKKEITNPTPANYKAISNRLNEQKQQIQQAIFLIHCLLMCKTHRFDEALNDINKVIEASQINPWAENLKGLIYLEKYYRNPQDKDASDNAVKCFQSALLLNNTVASNDPNILGNLAYAYTVQRNYPQAMQVIQKAFALDAKHPMILTSYAIMLFEKSLATDITTTHSNSLRQALSYLNAALYNAPKNPFILYYRGLLHMLLGNPSSALQDFDQLKQVKLPGASVSLQRGKLLIQLGRYQEALQDLDYANSFRQNDSVILYFRGIALFKLGYSQAAKESFQQAQDHLITSFNEQLSKNTTYDFEKMRVVNKQAFQAMVEQALSDPQVAVARYAFKTPKTQTDIKMPLIKLCLSFSNVYAQPKAANANERGVIETTDIIKICNSAKTNNI